MQTFMRSHTRDVVGADFHDRFHGLHERGELLSAQESAQFVADVVISDANGTVTDIRDAR
jgi:hypothetical protein